MAQGIFISYRRSTGSTMAQMIQDRLWLEKKIRCFLDVESLNAGDFRKHIAEEMDKSDILLLVLTRDALDRCSEPNDVMRWEIELALERKLTVIPVTSEDFVWPAALPAGLESIKDFNAIPYIHAYADSFFKKLYSFIEMVRTKELARKKRLLILGGAAAVLLIVVLCVSLWGKNRNAAPGAGPSSAPGEAIELQSSAPEQEAGSQTGVPAEPTPELSGDQILPESFLREMEALAEKRLAGLLIENGMLEFSSNDGHTRDVNVRSISLGTMELQKDALFFETGGTSAFLLYYRGSVHIDEEWGGEYPDAVVVFKLDSFPGKFFSAQGDGTISYENKDFAVLKLFESKDEYLRQVHGDYQYVDHAFYEIELP